MVAPAARLGTEARFRILKEGWSVYEILEGRATVWLRAVLTKLFQLDLSSLPPGMALPPGGQYALSTQNVVSAFFEDPNLKGPPRQGPLSPEEFTTGGEEIPFQLLDEPFNEYITQGTQPKVIRFKAVATRIRYFRTSFNAFGDPIVMVDSMVAAGPARDARPDEVGA